MEDEQIIALYFSRDELAIRETDEKYGRLCFQIANHLLQSRQECEECVEGVLPDRQPADSASDDASIGRLIDAFLRQQKADVRNVFLRRYWFFDSVSEIAARYHFSESKVKSILFRTRSKLRQYLKKEGVDV